MKLKPGKKLPRLSAIHAGILLALAGSQVHAQEAGDAKLSQRQESPGRNLVLGTRRTDRSVTDSASPVDVIGTTELTTPARRRHA